MKNIAQILRPAILTFILLIAMPAIAQTEQAATPKTNSTEITTAETDSSTTNIEIENLKKELLKRQAVLLQLTNDQDALISRNEDLEIEIRNVFAELIKTSDIELTQEDTEENNDNQDSTALDSNSTSVL